MPEIYVQALGLMHMPKTQKNIDIIHLLIL
jgi:hypothetical protein